jgi:hypothetical protein
MTWEAPIRVRRLLQCSVPPEDTPHPAEKSHVSIEFSCGRIVDIDCGYRLWISTVDIDCGCYPAEGQAVCGPCLESGCGLCRRRAHQPHFGGLYRTCCQKHSSVRSMTTTVYSLVPSFPDALLSAALQRYVCRLLRMDELRRHL